MTKLTLLTLILLSAISMQAQNQGEKVFATKTGQTSFNASSPIEKIAAVNNQTLSKLIPSTGEVKIGLLVKGFKFENQLMEDHFNDNYMESSKSPAYTKSEFAGFITNIKQVDFKKDGVYPVNLEGNLTVHNVTKEVKVSGTMKIAAGVPEMEGIFKIKLKDYNVSGAYIGEKIAPEVTITVKCKYQ